MIELTDDLMLTCSELFSYTVPRKRETPPHAAYDRFLKLSPDRSKGCKTNVPIDNLKIKMFQNICFHLNLKNLVIYAFNTG